MRQWIRKYSLTPSWTVNLKILLDKCVTVTFCPQLVFPIGKLEQHKCVWNDYSLYVISTVSNNVNSVNSVNSVNNVNSYSAVLPPSPMVFLVMMGNSLEQHLPLLAPLMPPPKGGDGYFLQDRQIWFRSRPQSIFNFFYLESLVFWTVNFSYQLRWWLGSW